MNDTVPLVIDIDGTFLKTDMLFEGFWQALGKAPLATIKAAATLFLDRPKLKARIAELADVRIDLLPVNQEVLKLVEHLEVKKRPAVVVNPVQMPGRLICVVKPIPLTLVKNYH